MKDKVYNTFAAINEYALYGVLFFLPISKAIIESLVVLALFCFLIKNCIKPDFKFFKTKLNLSLVLVFLFFAISLINSGKLFNKSLTALFMKWGEYFVIFLLFQDAIRDNKRVNIVIRVLVTIFALVSLDCMFQLFTRYDFFRHKIIIDLSNGISALGAAFNNYNDLASYLIVVLCLVIGLIMRERRRAQSILLYTLLLVAGLSMIFTFSRGGWVGFLFALVLFFVLKANSRRVFLYVLGFFISAIVLIPHALERFLFIFKPGGDANRFITWQVAWNMIKENPLLGKGLGTFMDYFPHHLCGVMIGYAHNCYLQIWAEAGIFSLLSFLVFLAILFKNSVSVFLKKRDPLILGLISGLFGFLVHSFLDTQFYSLQLSVFFWSMAGILVALTKMRNNELGKGINYRSELCQ